MYKVLLFDLDGTLTDPMIGITTSVQYALRKMGIEEPSLEKLTPFIGPPLVQSFKEFYHLSEEEAQQALRYYRERFSTVGLYENKVYPGMKALLQTLVEQGKRLYVATSKPTVFSTKILEHFELAKYFTAVIGSELDGTRAEKDEVIAFVLAQLGEYKKEEILMVGDRKYDILGARKNGIAVAAVGYGYGSPEEFEAAGPTYTVQTVEELSVLLTSF